MTFRRPVLITLPLALAATTLTACREAPAPTPAAPTPTTSGTPTPTATGSRGSGSAPTPQPIAGSSIPFAELAPTVRTAQNAQGTFRFTLQTGEESVLGSARCIAPLAWQRARARGSRRSTWTARSTAAPAIAARLISASGPTTTSP